MTATYPWAETRVPVRPREGFVQRLWRGHADDPAWARPSLFGLLIVAAALYLWDLGASGWANSFYSAAVQAGTVSWKAMFFGSSDASNFITVDKPPASLWVMEIFARVFGVNAWSILVPQALMGVGTVGVVYAAVRRRVGPAAGLVAGAAMALTPVAVLMFRFNNPDALLTFLVALAGYAVMRAMEAARTKWLVFAGVCLGFAFLTKTLQAFLVLPAFALVYLICAPNPVRRRIGQLLIALGAMVVAGGWWVAIVELWPKSSRPYIGGSQHNDFLELTFGYNGFGRISGDETGSVIPGGRGGAGPGAGAWGPTGITRLFNSEMGGQIAWLIPAAMVLLVAGLWYARRSRRTDPTRASLLLWGGSLVITGLVFSFMAGIFHPYYNVALAPYIAIVIGIGGALVWKNRKETAGSLVLAGTTLATGIWAYILLDRTPQWQPWLRYFIVVVAVLAAVGFVAGRWLTGRLAVVVLVAALISGLAGPAAYSAVTATTAHGGSLPTAGPSGAGGPGGSGRPGGMARGGGAPGNVPNGGFGGGGAPGGGFGGQRGQTGTGQTGTGTLPGQTGTGSLPGRTGTGQTGTGGAPGGAAAGGLLDASKPSAALVAKLKENASSYTWVAAGIGSQTAAGYQLATGDPVMAIGGFNGSDPTPTLAQFQQLVAEKKIHYFIAGGGSGGGGAGGGGTSSQITSWVEQTYSSVTVGGITLYDLTSPKA